MADPTIQDKLLDLLRQARAYELAFVNGTSEAERAEIGTLDHWSAKDLFVHISTWTDRFADHIEASAHGGPARELTESEIDARNAEIFAENRLRPWSEVETASERASAKLMAQVSRLTEEQLAGDKPFTWYRNEPLRRSIVANSFTHPITHLSQFLLERGHVQGARRMQEGMAQALIEFDPSDHTRGTALYNLACFHALAGEPNQAIDLLRQALPLRPDLYDWSKQDSDLDSLRDLAEFQALYPK